MKRLLVTTLLGSALVRLAPAQSELPLVQDQLLQYGTLVRQVDAKYGLLSRLLDLVSPEQMSALQGLRISPRQAIELLTLVQSNLPEGPLDEPAWKELRRKLTPKAEDILGSEHFDRLLELLPSPQQRQRVQEVLQQVAATPEARQASALADAIQLRLSSQQARLLNPWLDLFQEAGPAAARALPLPKPSKKVPQWQRHLLRLRRLTTGEIYAEAEPSQDFTRYRPQRYRILGGDQQVLTNLANSEGLPVRALGQIQGDTFSLAPTSFSTGPALMAVPLGLSSQVWHGQLSARLLSDSPSSSPTVELDIGRGQVLTARLDLATAQEQKDFHKFSSQAQFSLQATAVQQGSDTSLIDLHFSPLREPAGDSGSGALLQLSEQFLQRAADEFRWGHAPQWSSNSSATQVELSQLGLTLQGCKAGQVRFFGQVSLSLSGLQVLESGFELVNQASLNQGKLLLQPLPGSLSLGLSFPISAQAPSSWGANLERILGDNFRQGLSLEVLEPYRQQILKLGLLEESQLQQMQLLSWPSGDRRTSLLSLTSPPRTPAPSGGGVSALKNRIQAPGEWTLALSEEAINHAIQQKLPPMLPLKRPMPEDLRRQGSVTLTDIEVPEIDLRFHDGLFHIDNCVVNVHWTFGLFSGVEPGARFRATARLQGVGDPSKIQAQLKIDSLEFLSRRILDGPAEEQQSQKAQLIRALEEHPLDLGSPPDLKLGTLSARAQLVLSGAGSQVAPSELLLHGRLQP